MSTLDTVAAARVLEDIALTSPVPGQEKPAANAGFVNASMITCFEGVASTEAVQDVLDSQLFAWLAATAKYDVYKDSAAWWALYRDVLMRVGWTVQEFSFNSYAPARRQFTLADWIADVLKQVAPADAAPVAGALKQLQDLEGSPPVATFDAYTHDRHNGALQALVGRAVGGDPTVDALACLFSTTDDVPVALLPFRFSAAASTYANAFEAMTLNEQVYGPLRKTVREKLACNPFRYTQRFTAP